MSAFTPEQWAKAGEYALRHAAEKAGVALTEADILEARDAAVHIATGKRLADAGPDCR